MDASRDFKVYFSASFTGHRAYVGNKPKKVYREATDKMKPLVIGRAANLCCFKNIRSLPCTSRVNKNAWTTQAIFVKRLSLIDLEIKKAKRRILLLADNCSHHNVPPILENIKVLSFPHNCTAIVQPLDQSIALEEKKVDVKEALFIIIDACRGIGEKTIIKLLGLISRLNATLFEIWEFAKQAGRIIYAQTIVEFIGIDKELDVNHELADSEIDGTINSKSIKLVENNEFKSDDENDSVNCNTTSSNIGLQEAIDQTRKIRDT
ncbi:hypothetical protein HZS_404, partial [Henneguya salminicola]